MSYQVLARKWRPKNFETIVGQEHVVRALSHALEHKRLHHAYLFTGTRGVGKTTLSRILAKALNCVGPNGDGDVTAHPCGVCAPCREIDAGRFVDYIEMDAASNRGVDEMAQLLEQAVYAPSGARFKVYMIDEVHMLTNHAFNAMLKTLEEPPEYVKFILATTDPQKVPVTVLSRCLQFNLKQMPAPQIARHLESVLAAEQIAFERPALSLLGQAARGSMRDALSLTDQAIAYSAGSVTEEAVRGMLGALDSTYLSRILTALVNADGPSLLAVADEISARSLSFGSALDDLAQMLHRIALAQAVPAAVADEDADAAAVRALAQQLAPEDVQLYYEIAIRGRADLSLAPDDYAGFTMALLRMLTFRPDSGGEPPKRAALVAPPREKARAEIRVAPGERRSESVAPGSREVGQETQARAVPTRADPGPSGQPRGASERVAARMPGESGAAEAPLDFDGDWLALVGKLRLAGIARQLAHEAELVSWRHRSFHIRANIRTLLEPAHVERLKNALAAHFGGPIQLTAELGTVQGTTAAALEAQERAKRQADAVAAIESDPFVRALVQDFGGAVVPGSIKPAL